MFSGVLSFNRPVLTVFFSITAHRQKTAFQTNIECGRNVCVSPFRGDVLPPVKL